MYVITDREREKMFGGRYDTVNPYRLTVKPDILVTQFLALKNQKPNNKSIVPSYIKILDCCLVILGFFSTCITLYKTNFGGYIKWHHVSR